MPAFRPWTPTARPSSTNALRRNSGGPASPGVIANTQSTFGLAPPQQLPPGIAAPPVDPSAQMQQPPDPNDQWLSAYQDALGASRGNIEAQYGAALNEIAQREGLTSQAIGQLPGQLNDIYAPAQAQVGQLSQTLADAQNKSGLTALVPAGAEAAPIQAAMTGSLASRQADVPLLNLAAQGEFSKQRQSVASDKANALSQLAQQDASQRASMSANRASDQQKHGWDIEMANLDFKHQQQLKAAPQSSAFGTRETSADRGGELAYTTPDVANAIRNGDNPKIGAVYKAVLNDITKNPPKNAAAYVKRWKAYQNQFGHNPRAVSLALFDSGLSQFYTAGKKK